jgi:hypothetical protein
MTIAAAPPKRRSSRKLWIVAGIVVLLGLWVTGSLDRFFAQLGLDFLIAQGCLRTLTGVICGTDEIARWCDTFGATSKSAREACAGT